LSSSSNFSFICGVLFDFDGVIGDTMNDNYKAWVHALGLFGASFTQKEYFLMEGEKVDVIASQVLAKCGKDSSKGKEVGIKKDEYYRSNNNFRFNPGISETISFLKTRKIKIGCVSGGARRRLINDKTTELLGSMDALVTSDDVVKGKPDPEPYTKGSALLGLPPSEVIVVENAPLGVISAKAAGAHCVAVCTTLEPADLKNADIIIPDTSHLMNFFEQALTNKAA
jgi:beta-phosphoglucomutase